jgi:hypothetical protein
MGAISLARWLRPSVTDIKLKDAQLFNDVAQIQGQLARTDFNARLVRERLYDLAKRGAIFSPSIYSLLDKRIQREELALLQPTT